MGIGNMINPNKEKEVEVEPTQTSQNNMMASFNPEAPKYCLDDLVLTRVVKDKILDVAEYADLGFSPDGKYFVFAQYGVTDKDFEPYAEIYTVDVAKNDFLKNGIYKVNPGTIKSVKSGFAVFEDLYNKNKANIFLRFHLTQK